MIEDVKLMAEFMGWTDFMNFENLSNAMEVSDESIGRHPDGGVNMYPVPNYKTDMNELLKVMAKLGEEGTHVWNIFTVALTSVGLCPELTIVLFPLLVEAIRDRDGSE